jgi:hypothetical protein
MRDPWGGEAKVAPKAASQATAKRKRVKAADTGMNATEPD